MLILKKIPNTWDIKQHMADLPLITRKLSIWDYPISTEGAFVYTVYTDGDDSNHCFAKGAVYSALTFLDKTDLRARGIPIYFALQDTDYDALRPYFALAGVKDEFIIPFTPSSYGVLKIMDAFYRPELQRYDRLFMIDPDMFARKKYALVDKIMWDTEQYDTVSLNTGDHHNGTLVRGKYEALEASGRLHEFPQIGNISQEELIQSFNESPTEKTEQNKRVYIGACFVGFSRNFLELTREPYRQVAAFTKDVYDNAEEDSMIRKQIITEEDLLTVLIFGFQFKNYNLSLDIPIHYRFAEEVTTYQNDRAINHIGDCNMGETEGFLYKHWKHLWLTEVAETLGRLR